MLFDWLSDTQSDTQLHPGVGVRCVVLGKGALDCTRALRGIWNRMKRSHDAISSMLHFATLVVEKGVSG